MNLKMKSVAVLFSLMLMACGGKEEKKKEGFSVERAKTTTEKPQEAAADTGTPASERVELENKGVGPITSVELGAEIDQALADKGKEVYDQMCVACHRPDKKFIGPAPKGILERRSPEWVMNMILNPEVMIKEDPLAKDLLQEFNGAPMANQGLTEEQARSVLEYFRTL
ncbi:Cytochrome c, mono-and diheme variants [Pricia antarctica]|uniref:Cytochrome c, mono-and diheme variants n=1 Tax=Pricia antarctica TaxID=641691 RepID=A0A1G7D987_9FLAO|nr:cytochrome c [Pricia antarctica]SDE48112.1 Cytochrome c, mono-and diheme variants [Pricia antarctica]